ncbi:hypothetical protein EB796_014413 [Bugula neritina]|uniref:Uncharacterized protein n=1 Tax=Bugula neritina TaxID=10212 RepID=A0A7J7JNS7_BUGNE|nr:hypothetical protein EB796_014413 [Bugula neritina]
MSAAALTKKLLSIDFLANEANLANCLKTILQEFIDTRNPIFPRQDVLVYLLKVMVTSTNISLIKFVLAILTEFCSKSSAYDANFVKRHLINLKIVKILYCAISGSNLYNDKGLSESYLLLLSCLSDVLLPTELQITLTDLVPMCMSFCNIKNGACFHMMPVLCHR